MKKILMLLLLVCIILPVAVYAGPPEEVEGYFNYYPTECASHTWAADNEILRGCKDTGVYGPAGDFIGTSSEVYDLVLHGSQGDYPFVFDYEKGWYKGTVTFEGTVGDSDPGTMWIMYIGKSPGDISIWSGTWRILGGVEGLEGIHGGGTWESCPPGGNFIVCLEGKVHFN